MATLHDAVDSTKKILLYGAVGIIIVVVLYFLFQGGVALKNALFPVPIPEPDEAFGELPDLIFPKNTTTKNLTYTIDTVTGELPNDYPDRMIVYEIEEDEPTLQDITLAKEKVKQIGFVTKEREVSENVFRWTDLKTYSRTMTMNIVTDNFTYSTDFIRNKAFTGDVRTINETEAQKLGREFLTDLSSFPDDIDEELTEIQKFTVKSGKQVPSESDTDTRIIRIDYFQKSIVDELDEEVTYPILYPKPDTSLINVLVAAGQFPSVVEAHYTHHKVSDNSGEYYIKSPEMAFEELQAGKGYIAQYFGNDANVKIQEAYLAYYLGEEEQSYLQPIWVFANSTNGFFAYVHAIDDYWNESPEEASSE